MPACPHGDLTCPCQDNGLVEADGQINQDPCHYEGSDALDCPNLPPWFPFYLTADRAGVSPEEEAFKFFPMKFDGQGMHCHVEGCRWDTVLCGLAKLGVRTDSDPYGIGWACGARRISEWIIRGMEKDGVL